jgi:hypothetical protein
MSIEGRPAQDRCSFAALSGGGGDGPAKVPVA